MLPILAAAFVLLSSLAAQDSSSTAVRATTRADGTAVVTGEQDERAGLVHPLIGALLFDRSTVEIDRLIGDERAAAVARGRLADVVFVNGDVALVPTGDELRLYMRTESTAALHVLQERDGLAVNAPMAWALTPARTQDLLDAAVFFVEAELFPTHARLGERVMPWEPGSLCGESIDDIKVFLDTAKSTTVALEAFNAAKARVWDGTSLGVSGMTRTELVSSLQAFAWTPDAIGARVAALDYDTYRERRAVHFDVARTRFCTVGPKVPKGAIDVSKTAWERSEPAAVERAEKLLAAVGGVAAWSALDSVRLEVETATHTPAYTHTARSTTLRCLTRPLTLIEQSIDDGQTKLNIRTGFVGNDLWLERDADGEQVLMELPRAQIERAVHGERRALPRVLRMLATREKVGVKNGADGSLELFDDGGPFCRLELDADFRVRALVDDEGPTSRRLEYESWKEFAGVELPTKHREIGERTVEVTLLAFEKVEPLSYSRFLSPLTR